MAPLAARPTAILPNRWPLVVYEKTKVQFEIVRKILGSPRISRVVCATDAGREGELIFRYIYEAAQCGKPVSRLWISSLTPKAIRKGFETLRPGSDYDALADAARGRSRCWSESWMREIRTSSSMRGCRKRATAQRACALLYRSPWL